MAIKTTTAAHIRINNRPHTTELDTVFQRLRGIILEYKTSLRVVENTEAHFEAWTTREISIHGKKLRKGVMFASVVRLKDIIGFYFQPFYFDRDLEADVYDLSAYKKGLTCFHFMVWSEDFEKQIRALMDAGWNSYRSRGWV